MTETITMTKGKSRGAGIHLEISVTKDQAMTLYYTLMREAREFREEADKAEQALPELRASNDTLKAWRDNAELLGGIASMFKSAAGLGHEPRRTK